MKLYDIVRAAGMSGRPEYYSGRGAMLCDLNGEKLFAIKKMIVRHHGNDAGQAFVLMVANMDNMNTTAFLQNCYHLEKNNFKYVSTTKGNGIAIDKKEDGSYNLLSGIASIGSTLGRFRDDSFKIKSHFLKANGFRDEMNKEGTRLKRERYYYARKRMLQKKQ